MVDESDEGWSPEKERATDPGEFQKKYLKLLQQITDQEAERIALLKKGLTPEKIAEITAKAECPPEPVGFGQYIGTAPPTPAAFVSVSRDEIVTQLKKAWELTKEVAPDAPESIQRLVFDRLSLVLQDEDIAKKIEAQIALRKGQKAPNTLPPEG